MVVDLIGPHTILRRQHLVDRVGNTFVGTGDYTIIVNLKPAGDSPCEGPITGMNSTKVPRLG